jgi:hypothetical protein
MIVTTTEDRQGAPGANGGPDRSMFAQVLYESISVDSARKAMEDSWGLCARHAYGLLLAAAVDERRLGYATAVLYVDLLEQALAAMTTTGALAALRARSRLRTRGVCPICSSGLATDIDRADGAPLAGAGELRELMQASRGEWSPLACPECLGTKGGTLCREHLRTALPLASLAEARASVGNMVRKLIAYSRSFRGEGDPGPTDGERAGLVAALGWCAGWGELAAVVSPDLP